MRCALVVLLVLVGCKPKADGPGPVTRGCLELPRVARSALRAGPDGKSLYWLERVDRRDYAGEDASVRRLVRYDIATRQTSTVFEPAAGPFHFTRDGGVMLLTKRGDDFDLVHVRDGHVQSLVPSYFDVQDVEPIEGARYAVLAIVDGRSQVFTLDLDAPRPLPLVDARVLLSVIRGRAFVRAGDETYAVDTETGTKERLLAPKKGMPELELIYFVEGQQVKVRSFATGTVENIVGDKRDWTLLHQAGSVLAVARAEDTAHAWLLARGKATRLPQLRGGVGIVGHAALGTTRYALVAHNTSNDEDEVWNTTYEADVCILDPRRDVLDIETRQVPARYAAKAQAFWAAAGTYPKTRWQFLENAGAPRILHINIDEPGGDDLGKLRDRARALHKAVTRMFDDDELVTRIDWEDGRTAYYRWRRERLRGRATAGMGDVQLTDPADFDLDLKDGTIEKIDDDAHVRCAGKLTNLRAVALVDVEVRCIAGDHARAIRIPKLEPKQTHAFAETFDSAPDDELLFEIDRGRIPQVVRDLRSEKQNERLFAVFLELQRATKLALRDHTFSSTRFAVELEPPRTARLADVEAVLDAAAKRLEGERARLGIAEDLELELAVYLGHKFYKWTGTALVLDE